jgi:hypothetical protein
VKRWIVVQECSLKQVSNPTSSRSRGPFARRLPKHR